MNYRTLLMTAACSWLVGCQTKENAPRPTTPAPLLNEAELYRPGFLSTMPDVEKQVPLRVLNGIL